MNGTAALISIWFIFILIGTGCSGEEPSSSSKENVVVRRPIETVSQEKAETVTATPDVSPEPFSMKETRKRVASVEEKVREKKEEGQGEIEKGYYITERGDSLSKIAGRKDVYGDNWIINVLSAQEEEAIVPHAIKLIRSGYPAYITTADVNGKDWMRLRVGFYGQKEVADREGKKLMEILGFKDIWTTKVGDIERGEFGGY